MYVFTDLRYSDSVAEWSKALASGASPQGRGLEPHRCQRSSRFKYNTQPLVQHWLLLRLSVDFHQKPDDFEYPCGCRKPLDIHCVADRPTHFRDSNRASMRGTRTRNRTHDLAPHAKNPVITESKHFFRRWRLLLATCSPARATTPPLPRQAEAGRQRQAEAGRQRQASRGRL